MSMDDYKPSSTNRRSTSRRSGSGRAKGTLFGKPKGEVIKRPGALHRALGVKQGEKIPASKLQVKPGDSTRVKREKALARTMRSWKH